MSRFDFIHLPGTDPMGVLMRRDHPLAVHDAISVDLLRGVPLILPQGVVNRGDLSGWFHSDADNLDIVGTMNLVYNASQFVREGFACVICPADLVGTSDTSGLCFRPLTPAMSTSMCLAWKRDRAMTAPARIFLDTLRELVHEHES